MNCNLSRSQKAKANNYQKGVLSVISEHNKLLHEYGEFYVWLDILKRLNRCGVDVFNGNKHEEAEFLNMCLFGECLRIISKYLRVDNSETTPKEYNTDNIYIGQSVSNYKELCKLLEVEPKTGKSRQLQERDFLRYFDYEKLKYSNEYLILDVYDSDEIIPKSINARNSLYINQLMVLIPLLVSTQAENKHGNKELKTTFPRLRKEMNIVNFNYDNYKDSDLYDIRKEHCIHLSDNEAEYQNNLFRLHAEEKFKNSIRTALNHLADNDILYYETYTVICYDDEDKERFRQATPDEEMYIHNVKQDAAQQLGYTLSLYASRFKQKEFDKIIRSKFKHDKKWKYIFNGIRIISNDKALSTPIKNFTIFKDIDSSVYDISKEMQNSIRYEYNDNLVNALHKKINKSKADKEKKLLKWYKDTDKFKETSDDDLLDMIIPYHDDMKHYTNDCNRYRDLLVDVLIKL